MKNITRVPERILEEIALAREHLGQLREAMAQYQAIDSADELRRILREGWSRQDRRPMLCAIPTQQFQARKENGNKRYVYLLFRRGTDGEYTGPVHNGARCRKVYVGCDPEAIKGATAMIENRRQWERFQTTADDLEQWLAHTCRNVEETFTRLERHCAQWPRTEIRNWGLPELATPAPAAPMRGDR